MPGEADHRVIAAATNEALRLIKKMSKTQKHNEELVYQSIRGHEYANKSLNSLFSGSSPASVSPLPPGGIAADVSLPLSASWTCFRAWLSFGDGEKSRLLCLMPSVYLGFR